MWLNYTLLLTPCVGDFCGHYYRASLTYSASMEVSKADVDRSKITSYIHSNGKRHYWWRTHLFFVEKKQPQSRSFWSLSLHLLDLLVIPIKPCELCCDSDAVTTTPRWGVRCLSAPKTVFTIDTSGNITQDRKHYAIFYEPQRSVDGSINALPCWFLKNRISPSSSTNVHCVNDLHRAYTAGLKNWTAFRSEN